MLVGLSRWCIRRRFWVVGLWIALLVGLAAVVGSVGSRFSDASRLPASDSSTAYELLAKGGSQAASAKTGTIVWHTDDGAALSATARSEIVPMLGRVATVEGVASVISPFTSDAASQVSADGRTAFATVVFGSTSHAAEAADIARHTDSPDLSVRVGGEAFTQIKVGGIGDLVGVLAALVILLLVFRSAWAAALPIVTGVAGVALSTLVVILLSHVLALPSTAPTLGALIGLGVGIDYALFIVNRQRKALLAGADLKTAITTAMSTSGRAVIFAGGTVMIALLGMLVLNVGFLTSMAIGGALTVLLTVGAALTLLPALLAMIGPRVLRRSDRRAPAPTSAAPAPGGWSRWARMVERRPLVTGLLGTALLLGLAVPALSLRLGAADASSDPVGTSSRSYSDTMSAAFGKGFDAQLLLVAETPNAQARQAWRALRTEVAGVPGVAAVGAAVPLADNTLSMLVVTPATASQDKATSDLVRTLRSDAIARAEAGTDLHVHVGGKTATSIDFANVLTRKLPLFLVVVAVLGFLLLTLAFRSLLVPAMGAIGNLLTIAVALGATVALFQFGWGPSVFGIGGPAPAEFVVAILIVGVMFGLSMDYHVFLISRMHEEWHENRDHRRAITAGVGETGRVISTAAAIMFCVFASFGFAGVRTVSEFGVGLAIAVLADAVLLRMTVVPAVMHLCGPRIWAMPSWLDRVLPQFSVEGPGQGAATHPHEERELVRT